MKIVLVLRRSGIDFGRDQFHQSLRILILVDWSIRGDVPGRGEEPLGIGARPVEDRLIEGESPGLDQSIAPEARQPGGVIADPGGSRRRVVRAAIGRVEQDLQGPGARDRHRVGHRRDPRTVELARLARVPGMHREQEPREGRRFRILRQEPDERKLIVSACRPG